MFIFQIKLDEMCCKKEIIKQTIIAIEIRGIISKLEDAQSKF